MLEMFDGKEKISAARVKEAYPNCHYILVDINDDLQNLEGRLYCVSHSHDSYRKLCNIADDMEENSVPFAHLGFYDDGHAVGIQYEIE